MTQAAARPHSAPASRRAAAHFVRLVRPAQWAKSAFVLIGPFYGLRDMAPQTSWGHVVGPAIAAAVAFALASSSGYIVNDIIDRVADRSHPRKSRRPVASGQVSVRSAAILAGVLLVISIALPWVLAAPSSWLVTLTLVLYVGNVWLYSVYLKHKVIADVMSLSLGFVLRVLGGCAAVGIEPSIWLLNVTLFLAMFLAFGKRLGERRVLGLSSSGESLAAAHRRVQAGYNDILLQMAAIATAVMTLMTYSLYVREQAISTFPVNMLLWCSLLPATYGLLRCVVKLELGQFDDPTELALGDRGFQIAALAFALLAGSHMWLFHVVSGAALP